MKIAHKAPALLIGVAAATSALSAWSSYSATQAMIESAKQRELKVCATLMQNSMAEQAAKAAARASFATSLPSIQEAFRKRDREQLTKRLLPAFLVQRDQFGVREGQFHLAPAISFLRIYTPKLGHGEDLSGFREMVLATNRKREPQRGVEVGRRGLSIRGIYPVIDAQGHSGSFEVGMAFTPVLTDVKKTTGFDAGVFIDAELMARVATLMPKPDAERVIGGYQCVEVTDWDKMKPMVDPGLLKRASDVIMDLRTVKGAEFGSVTVPVLDYKGQRIGALMAFRPFTEFQTQSNWALVRGLAMGALQLLLLIGALMMALRGMLLRPLDAIREAAGLLVDGKPAPQLGTMAAMPDEIGELATKLDALAKQAEASAVVPKAEGEAATKEAAPRA